MRNGPKPLPFQLGMASMAAAGLAGGAHFTPDMLQNFFVGIQKYQKHEFVRVPVKWPVAWEAGQAKLYFAKASPKKLHQTPIVLIPSMINKSDILDILPDRSMLRWFSEQGFDVYLLDWGLPALDTGQKTLDDAVMQRMLLAIQSIGVPVMVMGYCMGGLLATALASINPDLVRGLLLLATPWNFHDEKSALKARLSLMKPMALSYMKQNNQLPESWMQAVFATLDPESSIKKFSNFAQMKESDSAAELFVAVEDWLNDGVDLPASIAMSCMDDWYENNLPYKKAWKVGEHTVKAQEVKAPTFVVTAKHDKIVPPDSALAFAEQRQKCDVLVCDTGHIGLIAGRNVLEKVWMPSAKWFAAQQ